MLFYSIEMHSFDPDLNGYFEAFDKNWVILEDLRLSEKDANEKKTMNTHLHILEAYNNLYSTWKDEKLKSQLRNLIEIFFTKIIDQETWHFQLFFNDEWTPRDNEISFGHDIEGSCRSPGGQKNHS
jgi:mannobiose 2-epimerase